MPPSSRSYSYLLREPDGISTKTTASPLISARGARGDRYERVGQIRNEVVCRLDSDGEADEVRRRGERRVGGRGVRHPRRHLDQALDAAERLGELEEPSAAGDRRRLLRGLGGERDHAAETAHLACPDRVTLIRRQAG